MIKALDSRFPGKARLHMCGRRSFQRCQAQVVILWSRLTKGRLPSCKMLQTLPES